MAKKVTIAWVNPTPNTHLDHLEVWRKTGIGGTYAQIGSDITTITAGASLSVEDTNGGAGLPDGTQFYYQVRAYNATGEYSNVEANITISGSLAIAAPTSLAAGTPTSTTLPLTWVKSVSGVMVSYRVYDDGVLLQTFTGDVDAGTLTGLSPSTTYTNLTVRAFNGTVESPSSNAVNGTTSAPPAYVPLDNSNTTLQGTITFTAGSPAYFSGTADQGRVTAQYLNNFDLRFYLLDGFAKAVAIGFSDNTTLTLNNANTIYYLGVREALQVTLTNLNNTTVNPDVPTTIAPGAGRYIKASRAGSAASSPILIHYFDGTTETLIHTFAANAGATYIKFNTNTGRRLQNMEIR